MFAEWPISGWVAGECSNRLRSCAGQYRWDQWAAFCWLNGMHVVESELPSWLAAMHIGHTIYIRHDLRAHEKARWVWHEIGHIVMHPSNCWYWDALPWGYLVLGKQERQANEFAAAFPIWESE